jgi:hypothetical protein
MRRSRRSRQAANLDLAPVEVRWPGQESEARRSSTSPSTPIAPARLEQQGGVEPPEGRHDRDAEAREAEAVEAPVALVVGLAAQTVHDAGLRVSRVADVSGSRTLGRS